MHTLGMQEMASPGVQSMKYGKRGTVSSWGLDSILRTPGTSTDISGLRQTDADCSLPMVCKTGRRTRGGPGDRDMCADLGCLLKGEPWDQPRDRA